ncbi:tetratricopeptide repeat protein [Paraglaciecola arctica]|uniref:Sodium-type polar flagellar protein motX n=1 Tax=Paraglaciecola arctica BSs20135 TaxID=493475 RepID=K6YDQ1_9ALTE|nr:tetratricopeptide repeat protein [Paraglaciecola arctica]GAC22096.1 sodium-type polar flagellar protein motX [Paraglaciecola arctica BSs20135]|tara:strand:- start:14824 stop:15453 length:630 start_codon:yes stop_codon:yes gene_type:complete
MHLFKSLSLFCCALFFVATTNAADEIKAVQLYSQDELLGLINRNEHLSRVVLDDCQLVQDIQARAEILKIPSYQFLWGDMLAWGVCVDADAERGINYMHQAAEQGLAAGLEQLGRYYSQGKLVQQDKERAVVFLREASVLGNLKAQIQLAELFIEGYGSPYDYEDAYHWLYNAISADKATHAKIANCMQDLEKLMHPKAVRNAKRPLNS